MLEVRKSKQIENYFSQQRKILVRVATAHTRFVFSELDIKNPPNFNVKVSQHKDVDAVICSINTETKKFYRGFMHIVFIVYLSNRFTCFESAACFVKKQKKIVEKMFRK